MNETTTATWPTSGDCIGCGNQTSGHCTDRVHAAITRMIGTNGSGLYVGGLFPSSGYPVFNPNQCVQYVQEYLPFHLPQIEYGLLKAYEAIGASFPTERPVRILDIGSGPASAALALDRLVASGAIRGRYVVDAVEPSPGFCQMIDLARDAFAGGPVEIGERFHARLPEWIRHAHSGNHRYDWIIMANVLSPITLALNNDNERLNTMISDLLSCTGVRPGDVSVTFIEGNCCTYGSASSRFGALFGTGMKKIGELAKTQIPAQHILKCLYYRSKWGHCKPYVIMVTVQRNLS